MANTDSGKRLIAKLNNDNYYAWSYRMEMRFRKLGVWSLVNGTEDRPQGSDNTKVVKAWRTRMDLALSEIVSEVEDEQLVHTRISRDPAEVWARLASIHISQGLGGIISTWQKLFQMKKAADISIQQHVSSVRELADRLAGLGDSPSDSLLVSVLMLSLPPSYSSLVISLDSHSQVLDFDFVAQRCMNEEARQLSMQDPEASTSNQTTAFVAQTKPRRDRKEITCFKCGKKGHYRNECPTKDEETAAVTATIGMDTENVEEDKEFSW
jgi:gag-polypeptide of LTR copia-type/Zinc knuckle